MTATTVNQVDWSIEIVEESNVTAALDAEFRRLLLQCFGADSVVFSQTRHWHGSVPAYSVIARQDGRLVAHTGIIVRDIRAGDHPVRIYGIQNMGVAPEARGTGVGLRVLEEAAREADRRGIPFGVLFCVPKLERYYRRDGWETRDVAVRMDYDGQANIPIPGKNVCMIKCLTAEVFADGEMHLQGADW